MAKHRETIKSTAGVWLCTGAAFINSDISRDRELQHHFDYLKDYIPKTLPYCWPFASARTATFLRFNSTTTLCGTTLHRTGRQ